MKIVSDVAFYWFVIGMIALIAFGWLARDLVRLRRELALPKSQRHHDRLFGIVIGLLLASAGVVGLVVHFSTR